MQQNIFVKNIRKGDTYELEGYAIIVHNPEIRQLGSWNTNNNSCELFHDHPATAYQLEIDLTVQGLYQKVELGFILSDRFEYCYRNKISINTTRRMTELMQRLATAPSVGLKDEVLSLKQKYLLPTAEGEERASARFDLADALKNSFEDKIPDKFDLWHSFLRSCVEYIDWVLVVEHLDIGRWLYEPKFDYPLYDYINSLTWDVVHHIESNDPPEIDRLVERFPEIEALADNLQDWFIKELRHPVTARNVFAQLILTGIHCIDWADIARTVSQKES